MKKLSILTVCFAVFASWTIVNKTDAGSVKNRQIHQNQRIHQGVVCKELTPKETKVLIREQKRIQNNQKGGSF